MASDVDKVRNGEPVGAWGPNAGQHALGPGQSKNGNGNGRPKNKGLTRLPSQPQQHFQDSSTGSSGNQPRDLEKIVNGNGGPRTGSSGVKGSGVSFGPGAGGVGSGPGPGGNGSGSGGGRKKKQRKRGGPRWSGNGNGNGNGEPQGPGPGSGTGYGPQGPGPGPGPSNGGPNGGPGPGAGPSSGPSTGNGGNGGPQKTSKKGRKFGVPFVSGYLRGKREEREQEDRLARPIAEEIAKQQFGIHEDTTEVTHYTVLGIPNDASQSLIESVYQAKLDHLRPENNTSQEAIDELKLVKEAYAVLSDPGKRKAYDRSIHFSRMTPKMQKKAMGEARTGMKYEQEIKNQARSMGIPLVEEKVTTVKVRDMDPQTQRAWANQYNVEDLYLKNKKQFIDTYGLSETTVRREVKRPVWELAQAIQAQGAALQTGKLLKAEQEDEYKQLRPSKATKVSRGVGKAVVGGFKVAGQIGAAASKSSARSGIGREVRGQGRTDVGSLRDLQAPALGAIRAAGAGGVRRRNGAVKVESPFGRLPITGKPASRKRKKGF